MILRKIITTEECGHWAIVKLECGHEVGPVSKSQVPKHRKRCPECEFLAEFKRSHTDVYKELQSALRRVPMDDRAAVLVQWIRHMTNALELSKMGVDEENALLLVSPPTRYSLFEYLAEDEEDS